MRAKLLSVNFSADEFNFSIVSDLQWRPPTSHPQFEPKNQLHYFGNKPSKQKYFMTVIFWKPINCCFGIHCPENW